jgi:hypothetical protein
MRLILSPVQVGPASKELKSVAEAEKELAKSEVTHFFVNLLN